jgi:glutathione peroxidase
MQYRWSTLSLAGLLLSGVFVISQSKIQGAEKVPAVLDFTMNSLEGKPVNLAKYGGKVVLIVNTASQCGLTPQYEKLQELHAKYAGKGLSILGFPANEFGAQEPGNDQEIAQFCQKNYGVQFDMFSKVVVKGDGQCPLYAFLTSPTTDPKHAGPISWNFEKFLVSRTGEIVQRFPPATEPDSPEVVQAVESELAKQ